MCHGSYSIGTWSQHGVVDGIRQGAVADQLGLALVLALGLGDEGHRGVREDEVASPPADRRIFGDLLRVLELHLHEVSS